MVDFTLKLEKGILKIKNYNEHTNKTFFTIVLKKDNSEMNFTITGSIRNIEIDQEVSFLYNVRDNNFKAFVFNKEELDSKDKVNHNTHNTIEPPHSIIGNNHHSDDDSIIKMTNDWKKNIPFLNNKKWFSINYSNNICSEEQLNQVYKIINDSSLSSTLKIGFQDYLSKLKHVRYKNIFHIEQEYIKFIQKQAEKAMGKK